jgi:undecaprenyl-diphosphatase
MGLPGIFVQGIVLSIARTRALAAGPASAGLLGFIPRFDVAVVHALNRLVGHSWLFDRFVIFLSGNNILKSAGIVAAMWWLWFLHPDDEGRRRDVRERILLTIVVAFAAIVLARSLSLMLPFRVRPIQTQGLGFVFPSSLEKRGFWDWSAFPSDHAVMFFSFAMSIWYISRRLGWILFGYVAVLISLPRLYLGFHYPSDIAAGAAIGIGMAWLANRRKIKEWLTRLLLRPSMGWLERSPGFFYACLFFVTYQIADMFDQVRSIGGFLLAILRHFHP